MRQTWVVLIMIVALGGGAWGQDTPRVEAFAGYSLDYASFPLRNGTDNLGNVRGFLNGWNSSATFNFNRWLGLVADFGGHYGHAHGSKDITVLPPNCFRSEEHTSELQSPYV